MCMQLMESTDLIPMDGDVAKITKRAEEFRELPDALQRNLQTFLTLTMDILAAVHQKVKNSSLPDVLRQSVRLSYNVCQLAFVGLYVILKCSRVHSLLDSGIAAQKIKVSHHLCWEPQVQDVAGRVFVSRKAGRRDCFVIAATIMICITTCSRF